MVPDDFKLCSPVTHTQRLFLSKHRSPHAFGTPSATEQKKHQLHFQLQHHAHPLRSCSRSHSHSHSRSLDSISAFIKSLARAVRAASMTLFMLFILITPHQNNNNTSQHNAPHHHHHQQQTSEIQALVAIAYYVFAPLSYLSQPYTHTNILFASAQELLINSTAGPIMGTVYKGVRVWSPIPYAVAPVGNLRWSRVPLLPPLKSTLDASHPSAPYIVCPQSVSQQTNIYTVKEDCLYLSISAPKNTSTTRLPVMVWIHGGSLVSGGGLLYDASSIVADEFVIVVTINYRLGIFGFTDISTITNRNNNNNENNNNNMYNNTANLGFIDQIVALKWVKINIASFGGDPNSVTLFGSDAGGTCICHHLASPMSSGLFHRAIIQSGQCTSVWTSGQSRLVSANILYSTPCMSASDPVSCLYQMSFASIAQSLNGAYSAMSFQLTIDNEYIINSPDKVIRTGHWNQVPVIIGTNGNEMTYYLCPSYPDPGSFNLASQQSYLSSIFSDPGIINSMISAYPSSNYPSPSPSDSTSPSSSFTATVDLLSDFFYRCPSLTFLDSVASSSSYSFFYFYQFNVVPGWSSSCYLAQHAVELPLFFPSLVDAFQYQYKMTQSEAALAKNMREVWTNFAKTTNPTAGLLALPQFCPSNVNLGVASTSTSASACGVSGSYLSISNAPPPSSSSTSPPSSPPSPPPSFMVTVQQGFRASACAWWRQAVVASRVQNSTILQPNMWRTPSAATRTRGRSEQLIMLILYLIIVVLSSKLFI